MDRPSPLARYLLAAYALLVVYASLYPFSGWRALGVAPLALMFSPLPRYITAFDLAANLLAYAPLGFLAVLALAPALRGAAAVAAAALGCVALSFALESLQLLLPARIASNVDLAANATGALAGALAGAALAPQLHDGSLYRLRHRIFRPGSRIDLGIALLSLWLFSQLNPETLLFGSGDLRRLFAEPSGALYPPELFIRVEASVAAANTLAALLAAACMVAPAQPVRALMLALLGAALAVRTLAFGVLFSAGGLFAWLTPGAALGVAVGTLAALALVALPRTARLATAGFALMAGTALVNIAPGNPYLNASIAVWQQGHFLNFNGLTRLGSLAWPFALAAYLVLLASDRAHARDAGRPSSPGLRGAARLPPSEPLP